MPNQTEFTDVILNRTQRRTPTVIRPGFKIQRIRQFYMRKVRFTGDGFTEKLQAIVDSFPRINDLHPFHRDLLDTLYEKNHYKISLASLSRAKTLIEGVSRDYVRLLKFGQSLFQCKQLKRAAMGRMATIIKRLKDPLLYLEQVRQHLGRLPTIDPNTRTLLICGYPNVGKSSFLRSITRAEVDVQPYAFTTKALYVGHFDYKYLRFQAIDTPGILDRPTEEMNNIEMQSIYAVAHLRSCVLYFMDLSEQCGFSIEDQVKLFHSIKPLFANKTVMVVINKIDLRRPEDLNPEQQQLLQTVTSQGNVEIHTLSCATEENVMNLRNLACEKLLTARIEQKMKATARVQKLMNRINVARPKQRDDISRLPYIPDGAQTPFEGPLSKEIEEMNGGAGVYQPDYHEQYILEDEQWKNDIIPELLDGRNVYDFIDPEIGSKLAALEAEEEKLEQQGFYDEDVGEEMELDDADDIRAKAAWIRRRHKLMMNDARLKRSMAKHAVMPRKHLRRTAEQLEGHFDDIGMDARPLTARARAQQAQPAVGRGSDAVISAQGSRLVDADTLPSLDAELAEQFTTKAGRAKAEKERKLQQKKWTSMGRRNEGDRRIEKSTPKHLLAGKRGIGKTDRR